MEPDIVYEDAQLLICQKPPGLAVQSASLGKKDLESIIRNRLSDEGKNANPYLGVIHRLDQPVQGLVAFAKEAKAAALLSEQARDGRMKKYYLAVTDGIPAAQEGTLVNWLQKDGRTNCSKVVPSSAKGAKKASLHYRVLAEKDGRALLEIELHTGRHHQIRVQMAASGTPLAGDMKYNAAAEKGQGIGLCAHRLALYHPQNGKKMEFSCQPQGSVFAGFFASGSAT